MLVAETVPDIPAAAAAAPRTARYAQCIEVSRRVRWEIDRDLVRGRGFDLERPFLPEGLTGASRLDVLDEPEQRLLSQVQGRTYANMLGLFERFIGAKMLEATRVHWLGDQIALEALVRSSEEELKHQALFRRIEHMLAPRMPPGHAFAAEPNALAAQVLAASGWAVFALVCHIELSTQVHYRHSLAPGADLCPLFQDVLLFHWKEESQHAVLDELEWTREHERIGASAREVAVGELITLLRRIDALVCAQAAADAAWFLRSIARPLSDADVARLHEVLRDAYRWQYIVCGQRDARFAAALAAKTTPAQRKRIDAALAPMLC